MCVMADAPMRHSCIESGRHLELCQWRAARARSPLSLARSLAWRRDVRIVQCFGVLDLLDHNVAAGRNDVAADPAAHDLADPFGDARLAFHQGMQIVGVEHQEPRARGRNDGGGSSRAPQHRDLAKEMTGPEPDALLLELDLDLAGGDEIHRMRRLAAARDDGAGLDLL